MPLRLHLRLVALLALSTLAGAAQAAAVVLWPVDPVIAADQRSAAIWIENRGDTPVTMQVRSLAWSQRDGEDSYDLQDAVVSSPPMAEIAPGARQLVRVIRRGDAPPPGEQAYRLLIDEVPGAPKPQGPGAAAALAVQMRYSIPLFTYGEREHGHASLSSRIVLDQGQAFVEVRNGGTRHARLTDLRWMRRDGSITIASGLVGYVLPGAVRRFALPQGAVGTGELAVKVDGVEQRLTATI